MRLPDSESPPYPAEVTHKLRLELGTRARVDLFWQPEVTENVLVQGYCEG